MTDEALQQKYRVLASEILPPEQVSALEDAVWGLDEAPDPGTVARAMQIRSPTH